jgi:hypothetical protein
VKRFPPSPGEKYLGAGDRRHKKINYKINSLTRDNKHVRQLEEISCRLAEMKKRILEDREMSDHESMTSFENLFQMHE